MTASLILACGEPDPIPGLELDTLIPDQNPETPCPAWCSYGARHANAVVAEQRHQSKAHEIHTAHGGGSADRTGPASVFLRLRQDPGQPSLYELSTQVGGTELYALLTSDKIHALHGMIALAVAEDRASEIGLEQRQRLAA